LATDGIGIENNPASEYERFQSRINTNVHKKEIIKKGDVRAESSLILVNQNICCFGHLMFMLVKRAILFDASPKPNLKRFIVLQMKNNPLIKSGKRINKGNGGTRNEVQAL
jgi:hypothetical protein